MKVVTGGQTGVDRAALDAAIALDVNVGGWCPADRMAEDGVISTVYDLTESPLSDAAQRTEWNVRDSDATLIVTGREALQGGTQLTLECAARFNKPHMVARILEKHVEERTISWIRETGLSTLNVAGPRESEEPGIYASSFAFLTRILSAL